MNANINKIGIKGQTSTTPFLSNKIRNMQKNRLYTFPDPLVIPYFSKALTYNGIGAILLGLSNQNFLTKGGLFHSALLGVGLWTFLGLKGYFVCVVYLILGVLVTKVKFAEKEKLGIAEKRGGARGPENVWGSASTAMICAILSYILPSSYNSALLVGYVSSLATKLSDTFQSEIGKAYGKSTFLITTLKPVPRGTEGAVSVEGYAAGIIGSALLAGLALKLSVITTVNEFYYCLIAALVGTTAESFIGATLQTNDGDNSNSSSNDGGLTNEAVNVINTMIGAITGISLWFLFPKI